VEQGVYNIGQNQTPMVPDNTTLIGRGNVIVKITYPGSSAFRASNHDNTNGNSRIVISGFKIVVAVDYYENHALWLQNTKDSVIEKVYITSKDASTSYHVNGNSRAIFYQMNSSQFAAG
jgi:hypothetical protein